MKKIITVIFVIVSVFSGFLVNAQLTKIGGGIVLATGGRYLYNDLEYFNKSFGLDIRGEFDVNKKLKIVPDFQFFLPNTYNFPDGGQSKTTLFTFDLNGHYILNPKKDFRFYFLGGAHCGGWNIKDQRTSTIENEINNSAFKFDFGVNAGAGFMMKINYRLSFFAEVKYIIAKTNQMMFSPGLVYDI
ncbi:MAG: hypothetical protein A2W99_17205 [Bacteroidetes bacterium GWF2_33_16]|nr:MAG: hypothetical protein A2X00_13590 [Bacteroidetes bacterium GWE2_32_14]OFY03485.1 MAG: hypothetical protein A2W99_17205 [Bacteroidetes bacterium GWF2_33_16]